MGIIAKNKVIPAKITLPESKYFFNFEDFLYFSMIIISTIITIGNIAMGGISEIVTPINENNYKRNSNIYLNNPISSIFYLIKK